MTGPKPYPVNWTEKKRKREAEEEKYKNLKVLTKGDVNQMIRAINSAIEYEETFIYAWTGVSETGTTKLDKAAQKVVARSRRQIIKWQKLKEKISSNGLPVIPTSK